MALSFVTMLATALASANNGSSTQKPPNTQAVVQRTVIRAAPRARVVGQAIFRQFDFPAPASPYAMTTGRDGNLWIADPGRSSVWRMTLSGDLTEFHIPAANPTDITSGPDGRLWFTRPGPRQVMSMDSELNLATFDLPFGPSRLAWTQDGFLWASGSGAIARLHQDGSFDAIPLLLGASPLGLMAARDGAAWFGDLGRAAITRVTAMGAVRESPLDSPSWSPYVAGLAEGPDGNTWFTRGDKDTVGKIAPDGALLAEYDLPVSGAGPVDIVPAPDGHMWVVCFLKPILFRLSTSGDIREFVLPDPLAHPIRLHVGPDGDLWICEPSPSRRVTQLVLATTPVSITRFTAE